MPRTSVWSSTNATPCTARPALTCGVVLGAGGDRDNPEDAGRPSSAARQVGTLQSKVRNGLTEGAFATLATQRVGVPPAGTREGRPSSQGGTRGSPWS